ncbi:hypothetical protein ACWDG9_43885 [Streptomyces sp. NPDC001073]
MAIPAPSVTLTSALAMYVPLLSQTPTCTTKVKLMGVQPMVLH